MVKSIVMVLINYAGSVKMKKSLILIGLMAVLVCGIGCEQIPVANSVPVKDSAQEIYVTKMACLLKDIKIGRARFSPDGRIIFFCDKRNEDKDFNVYALGLSEWDFPIKIYDSGIDDLNVWCIDNNTIIVDTMNGYFKVNMRKTIDLGPLNLGRNHDFIYLKTADGFNMLKLETGEKKPLVTEHKAYDICISPDGTLLAYLGRSKSNLDEIFVRELKTGKEKQLTFSDNYLKKWNEYNKEHKHDQINYGTGPFGKDNSIYFSRPMIDARMFTSFWNVKQDGSVSEHGMFGSGFSLSPDDKWLCYHDGGHGMEPTVFVTSNEPDYNKRKVLVEFKGKYSHCPVWSPDGSKIVLFEKDNDKDTQSMLLATLGGDAIKSMSKK